MVILHSDQGTLIQRCNLKLCRVCPHTDKGSMQCTCNVLYNHDRIPSHVGAVPSYVLSSLHSRVARPTNLNPGLQVYVAMAPMEFPLMITKPLSGLSRR